MKNSRKLLFFSLILYCFLMQAAFAERNLDTYYFQDIAITEVDNYDSIDTEKMYKKIVIQKIIPPNYEEINVASKQLTAPEVKLGETIWEITPQMLPINEEICMDQDIDICIDQPFRPRSLAGCYNGCVKYGPSYLSYDEKHKKLYILGDTELVGQKSGFFLGFVADLNSKQIKFLKVMDGYINGTISPTGDFIVLNGLYGRHVLKLYNTKTNTETLIDKSKPIGNIKWLSDKKYSYHRYDESEKDKYGKKHILNNSYKVIEKEI